MHDLTFHRWLSRPFDKRSASDILDAFQARLRETAAWSEARASLNAADACLRTAELLPGWYRSLRDERWFSDTDLNENALQNPIDFIATQRRESGTVPEDTPAGRLLVTLRDRSAKDEMAVSETDGFISQEDMPPWDTWIYSQSGYLLSYVPTLFVNGVNAAVQCVSDDCLVWAEDIKECLPRQQNRWAGLCSGRRASSW
jgi:hypothetical protein